MPWSGVCAVFLFRLSMKTHIQQQQKCIKNTVLQTHLLRLLLFNLSAGGNKGSQCCVVDVVQKIAKNALNFFCAYFSERKWKSTTFTVRSASATEFDIRCWCTVYKHQPRRRRIAKTFNCRRGRSENSKLVWNMFSIADDVLWQWKLDGLCVFNQRYSDLCGTRNSNRGRKIMESAWRSVCALYSTAGWNSSA